MPLYIVLRCTACHRETVAAEIDVGTKWPVVEWSRPVALPGRSFCWHRVIEARLTQSGQRAKDGVEEDAQHGMVERKEKGS